MTKGKVLIASLAFVLTSISTALAWAQYFNDPIEREAELVKREFLAKNKSHVESKNDQLEITPAMERTYGLTLNALMKTNFDRVGHVTLGTETVTYKLKKYKPSRREFEAIEVNAVMETLEGYLCRVEFIMDLEKNAHKLITSPSMKCYDPTGKKDDTWVFTNLTQTPSKLSR